MDKLFFFTTGLLRARIRNSNWYTIACLNYKASPSEIWLQVSGLQLLRLCCSCCNSLKCASLDCYISLTQICSFNPSPDLVNDYQGCKCCDWLTPTTGLNPEPDSNCLDFFGIGESGHTPLLLLSYIKLERRVYFLLLVYKFFLQSFFLLLVGMPTTHQERRLLNDLVTNVLTFLFPAVIL